MNPGPTHCWRYRLRARSRLNRRTDRREFDGALIRRGAGVGCIHPWPELGDATLDEELDALRRGAPLALGRRALECVRIDGAAREAGTSLFEGLRVPESHFTLTDPEDPALETALDGFDVAKLKAGGDPSALDRAWLDLARRFPHLRWRIDFNEACDAGTLATWWERLDPRIRSTVDFLEDPVPYAPEVWRRAAARMGVDFAVDRAADRAEPGSAAVVVWKPAVHERSAILGRAGRIVVTSSMDHAVGQAYAAFRAAELAASTPAVADDRHGLLTHVLFEPDAFFDSVRTDGARFLPPDGTGLGFDALLEDLPWERM